VLNPPEKILRGPSASADVENNKNVINQILGIKNLYENKSFYLLSYKK